MERIKRKRVTNERWRMASAKKRKKRIWRRARDAKAHARELSPEEREEI